MKYLLLLLSFNLLAKTFESGKTQVKLLELYTSQSCSSCPPAENWLNQFYKSNFLWKKVVPVAYHVTYWNHLSWEDQFSKEEFSAKQRKYSSITGSGVYTPQFVLAGKDYRNWRHKSLRDTINSNEEVGNLKAIISEKGKVKIEFTPNAKLNIEYLVCNMAFIINNQTTKVKSGENAGETISQNFITKEWKASSAKKSQNKFLCEFDIPNLQYDSIAFWVMNPKTQEVIQAAGGHLSQDSHTIQSN